MFNFNFDPVYLIYLLIGVSAAMFAEGVYLLFYNKASYRKNINRRLKVMDDKPDRESVLVQLRRERGLTSGGDYRLPLVNLNQLVLQSGLTIGFGRLILFIVIGMIGAFAATMVFDGQLVARRHRRAVQRLRAALHGAEVPALAAAEEIRRAVPRRHRHHRALVARRPSGADRHQHGGARTARPDRQRVRHRHRRDHLRRRPRNRDAQSLFPRRHRRPAAVRHRGRDPGLDRRQSRRNPGKPVGGDPPALQDAPQDSRAGGRRPRLGADPVVAADRHVRG